MKAIWLIIFVLAIQPFTQAQNVNFEWAKQLGGPVNEYATAIRLNASGKLCVTGYFEGTTDFDPGPGTFSLTAAGVSDIFISSIDTDGSLLWAKRIGGPNLDIAHAITTDAFGNIFLTGSFAGTADFDPGTAIYNLTSLGLQDIFIAKFDALGNFIWARQMKGNSGGSLGNTEAVGYSIAVDASGNVFTAGIFNGGTVDFDPGAAVYNLTTSLNPAGGDDDIFVSKLDANGYFMAAGKIGSAGSGEITNSIVLDPAGNVYLAGSFRNTVDFDPGSAVAELTALRADNFICKLDGNFNFIWVKHLKGNNEFASTCAITLDAGGNIITTGLFYSTVDFDPGPATNTLDCNAGHIFILKLNPSGDFLWAKQVGNNPAISNFVSSVTTDSQGYIYSTGYFQQTVDFDPGPGTYNLTSSIYQDMYVLKLSPLGNFAWAKKIGSSSSFEIPNGIAVDPSLNVYTTGYFTGTADFDPGNASYNIVTKGFSDVFVHKMSNCINGTTSTITTAACSSYTLNGQTYTTGGTYTQQLTNVSGCDSTLVLSLSLNNTTAGFSAVSCNSYLWLGQEYFASGTYRDTITNAAGCDSILTLTLVINPTVSTFMNASICAGQTYGNLTLSGIYRDTLVNVNGCDSIVILDLKVNAASFSFVNSTICLGQGYEGHDSAGIYVDTLVASSGCDSIRKLDLKIKKDCMKFGIPNAFTPNGDGLNDLFKPIFDKPVYNYVLAIYNRYGQKIFHTENYMLGWDGKTKNKDQPAGAYIFQLRYKFGSGAPIFKRGTIILLR